MQHTLDRLRVQRAATHICELGPRVVAELLMEIAAKTGDPIVLELLRDYARLSADALYVTRGDRFPPAPLRRVA